jgi:carboxypeptidase C (cathepsin A)
VPGGHEIVVQLGLLGPRRIVMGDAGDLLPPPYGLTDNAETLLRQSDLVFIDPVSTGYSRVAEGGKSAEFHGFTRDVESVGELIRLWTSRTGRWLSPKYLAGESYGTLRAAALAGHLQQRHGLFLNGIMLISSVLDLGSIDFTEGNDTPYAMYLPTYTSIAAHHGLLGDRPVAELRAAAEELAARDYPAELTGLSAEFIDLADLRVEHIRFFRELLRTRRLTVGRLDGRFTGPMVEENLEGGLWWDPSMAAITGPYTAGLNHWVRAGLGYTSDLPYEVLSDRVQPWSYAEFEGRGVSVTGTLSAAMRANPHLRVYVAFGYTDGATPYFAAEQVLAQLRIPESLRANITREYFEAGHMMYVHEPSRLRQSAALAAFVSPPAA